MTNPTTPRVIFLHLPKTGGMTLRDIVGRQYKPRERLEFTKRHVKEYREFTARPQAERDAYKLLYGHMVFGFHAAVSGETRYVTMLRDPIDRVISEYYGIVMGRAQKENAAPPTLEHWITSTIRGNAMTRLLVGFRPDAAEPSVYDNDHRLPEGAAEIAVANLRGHFAVVGLTESFDASLLLMRRAFGWNKLAYVRQNVGERRRKLEAVTPEARALIAAHIAEDVKVYAAAQAMFAAQIADYGASLDADLAAFEQEKAAYARRERRIAPLRRNRLVQKIGRRLGWF